LLGAVAVALSFWPRPAPAAVKRVPSPRPLASQAALATPPPAPPSRFAGLPALSIENQTTRRTLSVRLYDDAGAVDATAAAQLDELLCDARDPKRLEVGHIDRRTLQLLFKAAYHFEVGEVQVVSAYRKPGRRREGPHGTGSAIDFRLPSVTASALASYLRGLPRTGVGIYTHPKTQYVHLDSREHSFHWLDASPPRRRWREKSLGGVGLVARDAAYRPIDDLP
jgi:uncharacterized protein YcbK (DUF882 family)